MAEEVEVSQLVALPKDKAYEVFVDRVWFGGGGLGKPTIETEGDPQTHVGCIRRVPGFVREQILEVDVNQRIEYTIVSGPFPVKSHRGIVTFEPAPDSTAEHPRTNVVWRCVYEPYFGCGWFVGYLIPSVFGKMLRHMARGFEPVVGRS